MREGSEGKASDEAIMKLVDALDERNDHLEDVIRVASEVREEVVALRRDVFARPTRQEISHRRRVAIGAIILFSYFMLLVSDANVNSCSPGHKASIIVDEIAKGTVLSPEQFQVLAESRVSPVCDIAFPFRRHDGRDDWPTNGNLLGFLLAATAGLGGLAYVQGPRGWRPRREYTS